MMLDKFFSTAESQSEQETKQQLADFKEHPIYNILMFKKMIINHLKTVNNIEALANTFKGENLKAEEKIEIMERAVYNKSFTYIVKVDIDNPDVREMIINNSDRFLEVIDLAIEYFINIELYENCIVMNKIREILK